MRTNREYIQIMIYLFITLLGIGYWPILYANIQVHDDINRLILLQKPATRIITLSPDATEILFAIGAEKNIVGTVSQSNYPLRAKTIIRVGNYTMPNLENIVALSPDLIILPRHGISLNLVKKLKQLKINFYVLNAKKITDISDSILRLGKLSNHYQRALKVSEDFKNKYNQLKSDYSNRKEISVFYQLWHKPLMTAGKNTMINEMIILCGGKNIFYTLRSSYSSVSFSSLIAMNPEIIIVNHKNEISSWKKWKMVRAVKNKHIYAVSEDLVQRHSPRILEGIETLCKKINEAR